MQKTLYYLYACISMFSGMISISTADMFNWFPAVTAILCIVTAVTAVYLKPIEYINVENEEEWDSYNGNV